MPHDGESTHGRIYAIGDVQAMKNGDETMLGLRFEMEKRGVKQGGQLRCQAYE
jgi:hypothetical protein